MPALTIFTGVRAAIVLQSFIVSLQILAMIVMFRGLRAMMKDDRKDRLLRKETGLFNTGLVLFMSASALFLAVTQSGCFCLCDCAGL